MFLKELKEVTQKNLFLELAALIMMADGNEATTCQKVKGVKFDKNNYTFFQNIDENKINVLNVYSEELGITDFDGLFLKSYIESMNISSTLALQASRLMTDAMINLGHVDIDVESIIRNNNFQLVNVLKDKIASTLHEYSQLEHFKKEIMLEIFTSGEEVLNINPAMIERFILKKSIIKQEILRRTAKELIAIRQENLEHFDIKEKKIILFELIGAGYSRGYFGDDEKSLLLCIGESLDIENEYIEEFLEVSQKLFTINKELTILINE